MAESEVTPSASCPQPLPERDYRGTLPPELRGEVLAWNLMAQCAYWPHMEKVIRKLDGLLAAADAQKAPPNLAGAEQTEAR